MALPKYGEETIMMTFRVPKSHKDQIKKIVSDYMLSLIVKDKPVIKKEKKVKSITKELPAQTAVNKTTASGRNGSFYTDADVTDKKYKGIKMNDEQYRVGTNPSNYMYFTYREDAENYLQNEINKTNTQE